MGFFIESGHDRKMIWKRFGDKQTLHVASSHSIFRQFKQCWSQIFVYIITSEAIKRDEKKLWHFIYAQNYFRFN
jgi:hypothetical protein